MPRHDIVQRLIGALLLPFFLLGCASEKSDRSEEVFSALPYYLDSTLTPIWSESVTGEPAGHRLGVFSAVDQNGVSVTENLASGRVTVVDFFFTRCGGICPTLTSHLTRVQDSLGSDDDLLLLSFSVTPDIDSTSVLKDYAESYGVRDNRWRLLSGEKPATYDLARTTFFADVDTTDDAFLHTESVFLLDREGRIRGVYNGTLAPDIVNLIADARLLLESGE